MLALVLGVFISLFLFFVGQNLCVALGTFYRNVLDLQKPNAQIVLTWMLLLVFIDVVLYFYVTYKPNTNLPLKPQPQWVLDTSFYLQLISRLLILVFSIIPYVWEANTDSSLAMFVFSFSNTLVFKVYIGFLLFSVTIGSALLWFYRNICAQIKTNTMVPLQVLSLILSDLPMFLGAYFGLPVGLFANASIHLLVVGLSLAIYSKWASQIDMWLARLHHYMTGDAPGKPMPINSKHSKCLMLGNVFSFLAVSRLLSWLLACLYGPTNWLVELNPVVGTCATVVVLNLWLYCARRLWLTAWDLKQSGFIIIPIEPALIYQASVQDFVRIVYTILMLRKLRLYRLGLKNSYGVVKSKWLRPIARFFCRRWVLLFALLSTSMPQSIDTPLFSQTHRFLVQQSLTTVQEQVLYSPWEKLAKVYVPLISVIGSATLFGTYGVRYIGQQTQAEQMLERSKAVINIKNQIDRAKLSPEAQKLLDRLEAAGERSHGAGKEIKEVGTILDMDRNAEAIGQVANEYGRIEYNAASMARNAQGADLDFLEVIQQLG